MRLPVVAAFVVLMVACGNGAPEPVSEPQVSEPSAVATAPAGGDSGRLPLPGRDGRDAGEADSSDAGNDVNCFDYARRHHPSCTGYCREVEDGYSHRGCYLCVQAKCREDCRAEFQAAFGCTPWHGPGCGAVEAALGECLEQRCPSTRGCFFTP